MVRLSGDHVRLVAEPQGLDVEVELGQDDLGAATYSPRRWPLLLGLAAVGGVAVGAASASSLHHYAGSARTFPKGGQVYVLAADEIRIAQEHRTNASEAPPRAALRVRKSKPAQVPRSHSATQPLSSASCNIARKGDECYKSVVWAMTKGISEHPEWYGNLTKKSRFDEFQAQLALTPNKTKCFHAPCAVAATCETATPDSTCYSGVKWDMEKGMANHPKWYHGLSNTSTFEEFQNHAHRNNKTLCPKEACNPQPFRLQTLFCWMVVRLEGYEFGLANAQLQRKAGIFACDDYVLVSTKDLGIRGVRTLQISTTMVGGGGFSSAGTTPTAPIFIEAWNQIWSHGRWKDHDWVIKADPDAVLIPERLLLKLLPGEQPENPYPAPYAPEPTRGQFVTNCDKMAAWGQKWGDGWPMMYGALEIISRDALEVYFLHQEACQGALPWQGMGEDAFMGKCLRQLKVGELFIKQADGTCAGGLCSDHSFSAYHSYKDETSWFQCWEQAKR